MDGLEAALRQILDDPAEGEAMGRRGRAAVEAHYAWVAEGERLVAFYRALGGQAPGAAARAAVPVA